MSKSHMRKTTAFAPASIGNLSLGFDILGAALCPIDNEPLGDTVEVNVAEQTGLTVSGRFADRLPGEAKDNIVLQCYDFFVEQLNEREMASHPVAIHLVKRLPIGSGLGSSAASIVAALHAYNEFYQKPFNQDQLLHMMGELEGRISGSVHYDNVAPAYLGGITLMTGDDDRPATILPAIQGWYWVACYSGLSVSTSAARKILPDQYSREDLLTFGRQLGVFVDALHRGDAESASRVMHDVVAEPWRKSLLPGFDDVRQQCLALNGKAFGISGSGPTVFCVAENLDDAHKIKEYLDKHYVQNDDGFSHICTIPDQGATAEYSE